MRLAYNNNNATVMINIDYISRTPYITGEIMDFYSFSSKIHISLMCHDEAQGERFFRLMLTKGFLDITERMIKIDNDMKLNKK